MVQMRTATDLIVASSFQFILVKSSTQARMWLYGQIANKMAVIVHACCLPSENGRMLVLGTNHNHNLDLNWQSMSAHYEHPKGRASAEEQEQDVMHHWRAHTPTHNLL